MSNGIARPSSLLQPTRTAPAPAAPPAAVPMQGQPGPQDMQAMLALLMMMLMQGGMGGGAPVMPLAAHSNLPGQGVPGGPQI